MRTFLKIFLFAVLGVFFIFLIFQGDKVSLFDSSRTFFTSIFQVSSLRSKLVGLELENESLKNKLRDTKADITSSRFHYKIGYVYSRYPSNDLSTIVINIGTEDGVSPGMPVMAQEGVLLGRIYSVSRTRSEVETIFSPRWKSSVGIGEKRVKGVLQGSHVPVAGLIPKESSIEKGDGVVNLSPEFPLYVSVGSVISSVSSSNDVWQRAEIKIPYALQEINSVMVLTDFP